MNNISVHVGGGECYFSINLRKLRLQRQPRLSQERVAQKVGVSRATYAKYEQGRRIPPAWFMFSIANYFGVSLEDMMFKQLSLTKLNADDENSLQKAKYKRREQINNESITHRDAKKN